MRDFVKVKASYNADGTLDRDKIVEALDAYITEENATASADQDTVAVELTQFLLDNPGIRSLALSALARGINERRIENGFYKDAEGNKLPQEQKDAMYTRLEEVLGHYIHANPDQFVVGKKGGVAIRFATGEASLDKDGEPLKDETGAPVQRMRHTEEEWNKMVESAEASKERRETKKAAKEAAKAAPATPATAPKTATQKAA